VLASVCQHYGLCVEYFNEEEVPNLLETPCFEVILALPSGSHRRGFGGRRENRAEILCPESTSSHTYLQCKLILDNEDYCLKCAQKKTGPEMALSSENGPNKLYLCLLSYSIIFTVSLPSKATC